MNAYTQSGIAMIVLEGYGYTFGLLDCASIGEQQGFVAPPQIIETPYVSDAKPELLTDYPNPADHNVYFNIGGGFEVTANQSLRILDSMGRIITTIILSKGQTRAIWNCEAVPKGIYFYQLRFNENTSLSGSILVQ